MRSDFHSHHNGIHSFEGWARPIDTQMWPSAAQRYTHPQWSGTGSNSALNAPLLDVVWLPMESVHYDVRIGTIISVAIRTLSVLEIRFAFRCSQITQRYQATPTNSHTRSCSLPKCQEVVWVKCTSFLRVCVIVHVKRKTVSVLITTIHRAEQFSEPLVRSSSFCLKYW